MTSTVHLSRTGSRSPQPEPTHVSRSPTAELTAPVTSPKTDPAVTYNLSNAPLSVVAKTDSPSAYLGNSTSLARGGEGGSSPATFTGLGAQSGGGYGSLSLATNRRKRASGAPTKRLYVRTKDSVASDALTRDTSSAGKEAGAVVEAESGSTSDGTLIVPEDEAGEGGPLALVNGALSTLTGSSGEVVDMAMGAARALAKPVMTAAFVLIFLLLLGVYTLQQSRRTVQQLIDAATVVNDQLVSVSASLTEQYVASKEYADALAEPYRRAPPIEVEAVTAKVQELRTAKDDSVTALHRRLGYPGPKEDIEFLIDQHVAYERRLQKLALAELEWLHVSHYALRARLQSRQRAYVVIGQNADSLLEPLLTEVQKQFRSMAYPLNQEYMHRPFCDEDDDEDDPNGGTGDGTHSANAQEGFEGQVHSPGGDGKDEFGAFLETEGGRGGSPRGRGRHGGGGGRLDFNISARSDAQGSKGSQSLFSGLLANRFAVFCALCLLMFLYYRVG